MKGIDWLNIAANRNDLDALYLMGEMAERGAYHFPKNLELALDWYRKAKRAGSDAAAARLMVLCNKPALSVACSQAIELEKAGV